MASDWTEVGCIEMEDETAISVSRRDDLVKLAIMSEDAPERGAPIVLGPEALTAFRELLDRAAMPGQAEAGGAAAVAEPLAQMTDEVSRVGLSLHRGKGAMPDYLITTADGRSLLLNVTEWLGVVELTVKWLEKD